MKSRREIQDDKTKIEGSNEGGDKSAYRKVLSPEDIDMLSSGFTAREVREGRMVRLFKVGYEQGGAQSSIDIALLLNVSPATVSMQVREYTERTKEVVPTRGIVHDLGRAITHERIIIGLYLEGYLTPEIVRMTKHLDIIGIF